MEYNRPVPDARLLRAARSLHYNRAAAATAAERLERAEEAIRSWLTLSGHAQAMLGMFHVALEGETITISKVASPDATQLPLPGEGGAYEVARAAPVAHFRNYESMSEEELAVLVGDLLSLEEDDRADRAGVDPS